RSAAEDAPSTETVPSDGSSSPQIMLRSVDLPHPLGPTITTRECGGTSRSIPDTAVVDPNRLVTPRSTSPASSVSTAVFALPSPALPGSGSTVGGGSPPSQPSLGLPCCSPQCNPGVRGARGGVPFGGL